MSKSHVVGRASEPTPAQLKEFFAQIESGRITKERLQTFLRDQDLVFPSYSIAVDYRLTVDALVRNGKYDFAHSNVTSRNFPSEGEAWVTIDVFLLDFNRYISSENAIKEMDRQGMRPATIRELLALGIQRPDLQQKNPIVALGSTCHDLYGDLSVPCLDGELGRNLYLSWFRGNWGPLWQFAAVCK